MPSAVATRTLTAAFGAVLAVAVAGPPATADPPQPPTSEASTSQDGWGLADRIERDVTPPTIPQRPFDITDYGADPTGKGDSTDAIAHAIDAAADKGGGRVVVPPGDFHTGAIHLRSNIDLHVSDGATVHFSQDPADYLPAVKTRWEGVELYNYSPFVYAHGAHDVAITGGGTLDGQADDQHWWPWKERPDGNGGVIETEDRDQLFDWAADGVPVEQRRFDDSKLRPNFVQFYESENIEISGVTLTNSPMWMIHPVLSENVTVDDVTLDSPDGPNSDGVDPESSKNVVIKNSEFDNGDDCIAVKSGRNEDGRRIDVPSENIVVRNNTMADGHGGVTIGSEVSGSAYNVFAEDNVMDSAELERGLRIKTNSVRGGTVDGVYFRNNRIPQVADEVVGINFQYEEGDAGRHTPTVRNVRLEDVHSNGGEVGLYLRGYARSPITDVTIRDSTFSDVETPMELEHVQNLRLDDVDINDRHYDDEVIDRGANGADR